MYLQAFLRNLKFFDIMRGGTSKKKVMKVVMFRGTPPPLLYEKIQSF